MATSNEKTVIVDAVSLTDLWCSTEIWLIIFHDLVSSITSLNGTICRCSGARVGTPRNRHTFAVPPNTQHCVLSMNIVLEMLIKQCYNITFCVCDNNVIQADMKLRLWYLDTWCWNLLLLSCCSFREMHWFSYSWWFASFTKPLSAVHPRCFRARKRDHVRRLRACSPIKSTH